MLMIRPLPAGIMCASASCVRMNAPPRFTSIARHHSAVWACHNGPTGPLTPALLTRMSTVPSLRRSSVTAAAVALWSVTSATAAAAMPPARWIWPTVVASSSADRAMRPTAAPAPASRTPSSLPTPRPPPLTSATIPSSGRPPTSPHRAGARIAIAASVPMAVPAGAVPAGADLAVRARVTPGEQPAKDLPRRRPGDAVGELDLAHPFVAGHALGHPRHQFLLRCRGPQHDKGLGYLPGQIVGPADDCRVRHRRMGQQDGLELGWRHLVSLVLDQFLDPVGHVEPPGLVGGDDVAGVDPSVGVDRGRGRPRIAEIPAHGARRAHQQLARLAGAQIGPGAGINYPALHAGQGGADGFGAVRAGVGCDVGTAAHLGHAVGLLDPAAEPP